MFPDDDSVEVARYNPGPILLSAQSAPRKTGLEGLNVQIVFQGAAR